MSTDPKAGSLLPDPSLPSNEKIAPRPSADEAVSIDQRNDAILRGEISYGFGLTRARSESNLPVVCCLIRDGAYWLPSFFDHYRSLGVKEFFFLDNGSNDQTLEILAEESGVGVYLVDTRYFRYFNQNLRRLLVQIVRPQGWTLGVDIDELFDYPYSDEVTVSQLCAYLDHFRYDSMSTHQLDMFPEAPINDLTVGQGNDLKALYPFYSLQDVRSDNYQSCMETLFEGFPADAVTLPSDQWKFYFDGIRFRKLGAGVWLTKHALFKAGQRLVPYYHAHIHRNLRIADVSGVLYHYKFTPYLSRQIETALEQRQYAANSHDYVQYSKALNTTEKVVLRDSQSRQLRSVDDLLDQSFVEAPDHFKGHLSGRQ